MSMQQIYSPVSSLSSTFETVVRSEGDRRAARWDRRVTVPSLLATSPTASPTSANSVSTAGIPTGRTFHRWDSGKFTFGGAPTRLASTGTVLADHTYVEASYVSGTGGHRPAFTAAFVTDAPVVEVDYLGTTAPAWRIRVDGQYVDFTGTGGSPTLTPASATEWVPANCTMAPTGSFKGTGSSHYLRLTFSGRKMRHIVVESSFMAFGGVYVSSLDAIYPARAALPRWWFYGDSIVAASGALSSMTSFSSICAERMGVDAVISGAGGSGYIAAGTASKFATRAATDLYPFAATIDRLIVSGGINDGASTPEDIGTEAAAFYEAIAANLPGVPVTVLTNHTPGTPTVGQGSIRDAIVSAANAAANVDSVVDITGWITGTGRVGATASDGTGDRFTSSDATHPTQEGHEFLGRRLAEVLIDLA